MQAGDALETCADIADLQRDIGFAPSTPFEEGLRKFVAWYRGCHGIANQLRGSASRGDRVRMAYAGRAR